MLSSYYALQTRIDRFITSVRARYGEQIICRPQCAECCQAGLTLVMVEAVAIGTAFGAEEERIYLQAGQPPLYEEGKCALLGSDDYCRIYKHRPLICRTHGLPLKYPDNDEIVVCPKNFVSQTPHSSAVLDMANMEASLFAVNLDYCRRAGLNPLARIAIDRLAKLLELSENG